MPPGKKQRLDSQESRSAEAHANQEDHRPEISPEPSDRPRSGNPSASPGAGRGHGTPGGPDHLRSLEDYLAWLNLEGGRQAWRNHRPCIDYLLRRLRPHIHAGMTACEVGIGDGHLLRRLAGLGLTTVGIDISGYLVRKLSESFAQAGLATRLVQRDIAEPFEDLRDSCDLVFCFDLLEHIEGDGIEHAVGNIQRMLKQGGKLLATVPWRENIADSMVLCPRCRHTFHRVGHFRGFHSVQSISEMLGSRFELIEFGFVPGLGFINRMKDLLKQTLFRRKYYVNGLRRTLATCYFVARWDG